MSNAKGWKIPLRDEGFESFDRDIDAFWMDQQGILFLPHGRLVVYQVKRSTRPATLAPRDASGGTGNFTLSIKALSSENGQLIKSLILPTSGMVSSVMATRDGRLIVRAGSTLHLYSADFAPIASRTLPVENRDDAAGWQVQVSPSGDEVVLIHEKEGDSAGADGYNAGRTGADAENDETQGGVEILDAETLKLKVQFTLAHVPLFWTPADDLLLSSNPAWAQSDRPIGWLDFQGRWSPVPSAVEQAGNSCRSSVRPIDQHRIVVFGCDAFSVFSTDGKQLFSRKDERFIFRSIAASGPYLAASCDHYRLAGDMPDGNSSATTRPDRIEVYDLDRHARTLSFHVRSLRVYYAISAEGDLAVIDGASLEVVRAGR
jgi:hypothetical protein